MLLALAAAQAAPQGDEAALRHCTSLVRSKPDQALSHAEEWRMKGGGIQARQCLGLAYVALERWQSAASVFEQAARDAAAGKDPRRSDLWVQSGNAWLAADVGEKARKAFDAALAEGQLSPELRGEVHLDRARAGVSMADLGGARADIDKGLELVPADPMAWYLSAALALREGNMARANSDIARAVQLAPDDPGVLLQAGTIVGTNGDIAAARAYYARAAKAGPDTDAGRSAKAALLAAAPEAKAD
jgi:tetratricopeptide (TPR) repeat protein